jgi:hypothetical protein
MPAVGPRKHLKMLAIARLEILPSPLSDRVGYFHHVVVYGKFSKSRRRGWSWYAGDWAITGSFGEDAHHDQEAG